MAAAVPPVPPRPPYAEVTVYGRGSKVNVSLPPPWNDVKGMAIDGGMVFRLPAKTRAEVDAIRRRLDAEPTLREKRGKPLTYDLVSFFDLVADDIVDLKKTIGMFAADHFLVRIEGESNGVLRVSTVSPAGLRGRLKTMFHVQDDGENRLVLKPKVPVRIAPGKPESPDKPERPESPDKPATPDKTETPGTPGWREPPKSSTSVAGVPAGKGNDF